MASNNTQELKGLSDSDVQNKIKEVSSELSKMKFDHAVKGLANPLLIRSTRKEVARLKTEDRAREMALLTADDLKKRSKIRLRRK